MNFSFKKRIALFNSIAVAITIAVVFIVIYFVVSFSSYQHLDTDLKTEKGEIVRNLMWTGDSIILSKLVEWNERAHSQVDVNPTFIQIIDLTGHSVFKSRNLRNDHFHFDPPSETIHYFNKEINGQRIRQGQFPLFDMKHKIIGQLTIGVSQQESYYVLNNLKIVLCLTFILVLIVLYLIMSLVASQAIEPVNKLIKAASEISEHNFSVRLPLPEHKDELYQLAYTMNDLLNRLETGIDLQKQFTADASHEMRTPLAVLRGTIEVLMRKERTAEQYEAKMKELLYQTNRLTFLFDQLLELSRLESNFVSVKKEHVLLFDLLQKIKMNHQHMLDLKKHQVMFDVPMNCIVEADEIFLERILNNLFSNAIKYNKPLGNIYFQWNAINSTLSIRDEGIGISAMHQKDLFNRFYRADNSRSSDIQGNGLGLSIVKKLCELQEISIHVESTEEIGSTFILHFPSK